MVTGKGRNRLFSKWCRPVAFFGVCLRMPSRSEGWFKCGRPSRHRLIEDSSVTYWKLQELDEHRADRGKGQQLMWFLSSGVVSVADQPIENLLGGPCSLFQHFRQLFLFQTRADFMSDVLQRRVRQLLSFLGCTSACRRVWDLFSSRRWCLRSCNNLSGAAEWEGGKKKKKSQIRCLRVLLISAGDVPLL